MTVSFAAASVAMAMLVASASAQTWIRLRSCTTDGLDGWAMSLESIPALAERATMVRICTRGSTSYDDCVTSIPNQFPIVNLRNGQQRLSHVNDAVPCSRACVAANWQGPDVKLNKMWANCPGNVGTEDEVYHACGNAGALSFLTHTGDPRYGTTWCGWTGSHPSGPGLDLYIDQVTFPPSSVPSMAPTQWFEHPGHYENVTQLQAEVVSLRGAVRALEARMEAAAVRTEVADSINAVQNQVDGGRDAVLALDDLVQEVAANVTLLQSTSAEIRRTLNQLRGAVNASAPAQRPTNTIIQAEGQRLDIVAAENVRLLAGECVVTDLCAAAAFADRLQRALQ